MCVYNLLLLIGSFTVNFSFYMYIHIYIYEIYNTISQYVTLVIPVKREYCYMPTYIYFIIFYHKVNFYCCFQDLFSPCIVPVEYFHILPLVQPALVLCIIVTMSDKATLWVSMYVSVYQGSPVCLLHIYKLHISKCTCPFESFSLLRTINRHC